MFRENMRIRAQDRRQDEICLREASRPAIVNNMVERYTGSPHGVFRALGDPIRCELVRALQPGPATVSALAARFAVSLQAVSRHIGVLEDAGIVRRERVGRTRVVTLDRAPLHQAARWLAAPHGPHAAADAYARLDDLLLAQGHADDPPVDVAGTPASLQDTKENA